MSETTVKTVSGLDEADTNGDGHISPKELEMHIELKRTENEDDDE